MGGINSKQKKTREKEIEDARMKAIEEIAAGIAHELRNPLSTINMAVYGMDQMAEGSDERFKKYIEKAKVKIKEASKVIDDLISYSKPARPEMTDVDVNAALEDALSGVSAEFKNSGVRIVKRLGNPSRIAADRTQIGDVFRNVIRNSYEAMKEGGELLLKTECAKNGKEVKISVSDTGEGIAEEDAKKLGTPFFSSRPNRAGFGLAISYRYIKENHKGRIDVRSKKGEGTAIEITLPA